MGYIRDGFNPRGAEYAATARAAQAAENTQQAMDDMLALAAAPDNQSRRLIAQQIYARKAVEARRTERRRVWKYIVLTLIAVFCVFVYQLGDDNSAVSSAYRAFMATPVSQVPTNANAPVGAAQAPDTTGYTIDDDPGVNVPDDASAASADAADDDPAAAEQRGLDVLHEAGLTDAQINGTASQ